MSRETSRKRPCDADRHRVGRRRFIATVAATGAAIGSSGLASADTSTDFPPAGVTEWSDPVALGNGDVTAFTTVTPAGIPKYHGLLMERDALEGLPSADDLASSGDEYADKYGPTGESVIIHHKWSQEFFIPFPPTDATPVTFLGLNWNPGGHPPAGVWTEPHFDIHFHMLSTDSVDAITGPAAPTYDLPDRYVPEGYARGPIVDERVITDMGEHMVDPTVPEMTGGTFTNTLIWGASDPDGDGTAELTFVEPMITRAFLRGHADTDRRPIAQPETYARAGSYPTAYAVRDVPDRDAIAITIERFEQFDGED
ncbi:hypothetical protein [Natrinema longum]|uniref:DUF5602 domain-containing protein n=1 Tax=Natrinema longum TaxID=370324 RepID=A0A8A2U8V1_9EURY|nr:hypothetical protein [Natrinema longum]MBZ6493646.1 hypothetical protein [Natrinema longum]QSW85013.1 hypothetical protein J0X27_16435 [Natrinema longum]